MKKSILILALILSLVGSFCSPRFGRAFGNEISGIYRFVESRPEDGSTVDRYQNERGDALCIGYAGRFSRELQITIGESEPFDVATGLDLGIRGGGKPTHGAEETWQWVAFDLLASDSSGLFYLYYWLPLLLIAFLYAVGNRWLKSRAARREAARREAARRPEAGGTKSSGVSAERSPELRESVTDSRRDALLMSALFLLTACLLSLRLIY